MKRRALWPRMFVPVVLALGLLIPSVPAAGESTATANGPIVRVDTGKLQGKSSDGVDSFLGIPYAEPPVEHLRWQPPQPADHWSGVRPAAQYGNRCAALTSTNGPRTNAEDCLYLNVWRPAGTQPGRELPVYVFIHGGGLVNGSSNQASGDKIARLTNTIVVSVNYRLGVFGFLGLPGISKSGEGNYGLMDQQAALRWVQRNIAAFGGDPEQVTVGGESAGGHSVCGHLTSPLAHGLFARAMMQSAYCISRTLQQTQANSATFAAAAGCTEVATQVPCLRGKSAAELLNASTTFSPLLTSGTSVLPMPIATALANGDFARVPVVNGSNRDEGRTFVLDIKPSVIGYTRTQYEAWVQSNFAANSSAVLAHYPWPATPTQFTAAYLIGAIITDAGRIAGIGGCPTLKLTGTLAKHVPTFAYEFDARNGPGIRPLPVGYVWGAGHAAELAYLFPSFDNGTPIAPTFNAVERQLSRDMIHYWAGFARSGSPNWPGLTHWPSFNRSGRIMSLRLGGMSRTISTDTYRTEHQCGFWDALS